MAQYIEDKLSTHSKIIKKPLDVAEQLNNPTFET